MKQKIHSRSLWFFVILFVICIIAAIPRSIELINHNYVFGFDQGKHWLAAKSIVVDHKFPLIGDEVGGARGFFQGPGWFYLLAIPFFFFQGNPYGAIVLMFLLGMADVIAAYLLFAPVAGVLTGGSIALLLAISPTLISSSRFAWPPFVIPLLTVFYLFFVYKIIEGKKTYLPWIFLIIGVMANFEIAVAGTILMTTMVFLLPYILVKKVSFKTIGLSVLAFLAPLSPLIVFDLRHDFLNTRGVFQTFFTNDRIPAVGATMEKLLANHYVLFKSEFLGSFQLGYLGIGLVLCILLVGLVLFVGKKTEKTKKTFLAFLYLFPIVLFVVFIAYRNDLWPWWLLELQIIGCFLLGMILAQFFGKKFILWKFVTIAVVVSMMVNYVQSSIRFWKYDYPDYGGVAKIKGKTDALDFIFSDAKTKDFGLFFFTPPIYTYAYDFTNWWWGTKKYGYVPPQEKKSVYYLLAEPDPEKPWTYKGWLETAVTGGTDVATWTLPSGFILVKRTMP